MSKKETKAQSWGFICEDGNETATLMATPFSSKAFSTLKPRTPASGSAFCSSFVKNVCLHDWWLLSVDMDSNGRRLGVGGFASTERQGVRAFHSAAIVKRHDTVTLETADGITITLSGFINRSITHQNGFPSEVCNHFLFGFPYYWEEYATKCFSAECNNKTDSSTPPSLCGLNMSSDKGSSNFPQICLDDLPVTRIRDLLMSTQGSSDYRGLMDNIFNDILKKCGSSSNAFKHSGGPTGSSIGSDYYPGDSVRDGALGNHNETEVKPKSAGDDGISVAACIGEDSSKILSSTRGVATRSMTRLNNSRKKPKEIHPLDTSAISECSEPITAMKLSSGRQHGEPITGCNGSNIIQETASSKNDVETKACSPSKPVSRGSSGMETECGIFSNKEALQSQPILIDGECEEAVAFKAKGNAKLLSGNKTEVVVKESTTSCKPAVRRSNRLRNARK